MSAENNGYEMTDRNSLINQELYRVFVTQSSEAIWRIELDAPISVELSADDQIELFYRNAFLAECNQAMARMYGYESPKEIIGVRLGDLLVREDQNNIEYLRAFIAADYRLENAESHEIDRHGNLKFFLNNLIGVVEDDWLVRAWGTQRDITERREIEKSKARLAAIVETSDDAIISKDLNGTITSWNKGAEKTFGYASEEIIGKSVMILIPESLVREETEILSRIKKGQDVRHYETIRRRKDGKLIDISLTVSPLKNEMGEIIGASKIARDISKDKQIARDLQRSEELYRTLFESIDEGFCVLEMIFDDSGKAVDYRFIEINPAFEKLTGLFGASGKTALELVPDLEDHWFEIYGNVALTGKSIRFTEKSDAMNRWFEVYAVRVGKAENRLVALIFNNITERKEAEEKLSESEEKFAKAFNSSPLVLTITELKNGKLIEVNDTFVNVSGYTREETIGKTTAELGLWVNNSDRDAELSAVRAEGEIRDLEYNFRTKDGREITGLLSAELIEIGGEPCALTVIQDITERKKAAEISERYRLLSMRARDIILFFRPDGKIVDANQVAIENYGYAQADLLKMKIHDLRAPETLNVLEEQLKRANNGGIQFETIHLRKDGTTFPVEVSSVGADVGGDRLLISIVRDITERRKNEEIVRQSAKNLAFVTNIAPVFIVQCDHEKRFKFVNQSYAERFGLTPEECSGKRIWEVIGQKAYNEIAGYIEDVLSGNPVEFELEIPYATIGTHFMHCSYAPEFDENGGVIGFVAAITDISERRQMERAVRESERQLRQMADSMPQVVWIAEPNGTVTYYNNRVSEFSGIVKKDDGTWDWKPIVHPDDSQGTLEAWQKAVKTKENYVREHRIQMAGDNYRWHLSRAFPAFDENGEVSKWYGTATDIHDIKKTEEALRESDKRFRDIADNISQFAWMADEKGSIFWYNRRWYEYTGTTFEEMQDWGWKAVHHPDHIDRVVKKIQHSWDTGEIWEDTFPLRGKDGEYRWFLSRALPIRDENGKVVRWFGTNTDITERKQSEEALLAAETRAKLEYQSLLERISPLAETLGTARDLSTIYRTLRDFLRASMPVIGFFVSFCENENRMRRAAYVWGEGEEFDVGRLPLIPLNEGDGPNSRAVRTGKTIIFDNYMEQMADNRHMIVGEDNGLRPNSSIVSPMIVMNRVIGTLEVQAYERNAFSKEDIVALEMVANLAAVSIENVRLLQVEAEAREAAEQANRAKDEFLSVLSHELRTPLNSILGWTRMLRGGMLDGEKSKKAIEVIERNTNLQNNLIEDLLDVSRIISGKMRIEKESVDLVKLFNDTLETLRPVAAQKNIVFESENKEKSLIINGDATRIQQIISNLVQNAIKFTDEGGEVSVSLSQDGDWAKFVVEDNGVGINRELLPFIFERFRQADSSTKRAFSGLGLGLTIVHNLVELHGGTIKADSDGEGKGATFTVEIPLTSDFLQNKSAESALLSKNEKAVLAGARILLVDDDFESLIPLQLFLEKEKAEIVTANSVKAALDKLSEQNFDVLITDIGMPLADGYDLIAKVRQLQTEQNAFITAIALTAYASSEDRRRALASGFQEHFAKPVNYDDLLSVLVRFYEKIK